MWMWMFNNTLGLSVDGMCRGMLWMGWWVENAFYFWDYVDVCGWVVS